MSFDNIHYSLVWEDPHLLTAPSRGKRALSIAGAGDNALALLLHFDQVLAIDLNPSQIALIELKKASFKVHGFFQHVELMGYCSSEQRPALYDSLTSLLSPETRRLNDNPNVLVFPGLFKGFFELGNCLRTEGIADLRTIDGDFGNSLSIVFIPDVGVLFYGNPSGCFCCFPSSLFCNLFYYFHGHLLIS